MAITMSYVCGGCAFRSTLLDAAQNHANRTGHVVAIHGAITNNVPVVVKEEITAHAADQARELAIMREARKRGLAR